MSGFRVDLGIVHPDRPGAYLAGVECDGVTYHRSAVARDRDKTRQQVLENLGWNIRRVWSPDWWYDAATAADRLHGELTTLLDASRQVELADVGSGQDEVIEFAEFVESVPVGTEPEEAGSRAESTGRQPLVAHNAADTPKAKVVYQRTQLDDESPNQDCFFDSSYDEHLRAVALRVLAQESPIREDVLARQVARAHGFNRMGSNIRSRILEGVFATEESTGRFLWTGAAARPEVDFRFAANDDDRRSVDEIPLAELFGLIRANRRLLEADDPPVTYARLIGLARLSQSARERIAEAITFVRPQSDDSRI